ncbi:MAG: hypothetical protein JKY23_04090 [Nitrospinaceae bacterium]|nr:hypothetical protein [Nitrospinaceae bacterium]
MVVCALLFGGAVTLVVLSDRHSDFKDRLFWSGYALFALAVTLTWVVSHMYYRQVVKYLYRRLSQFGRMKLADEHDGKVFEPFQTDYSMESAPLRRLALHELYTAGKQAADHEEAIATAVIRTVVPGGTDAAAFAQDQDRILRAVYDSGVANVTEAVAVNEADARLVAAAWGVTGNSLLAESMTTSLEITHVYLDDMLTYYPLYITVLAIAASYGFFLLFRFDGWDVALGGTLLGVAVILCMALIIGSAEKQAELVEMMSDPAHLKAERSAQLSHKGPGKLTKSRESPGSLSGRIKQLNKGQQERVARIKESMLNGTDRAIRKAPGVPSDNFPVNGEWSLEVGGHMGDLDVYTAGQWSGPLNM